MRLIITRHAKSSWQHSGLSDCDRPLSPRGRHAASQIGMWLNMHGHLPDHVICSPAVRARQTLDFMLPMMRHRPDIRIERCVYEGGVDDLLDLFRNCNLSSCMLIGHNPTVGQLARRLLEKYPDHHDFLRFPTGATLICEFDGHDCIGGQFEDFIVPRDIDPG